MIDALIEKKMKTLPPYVQRAIKEFPWGTYMLALAKKYHLQFDDLELFEREAKLYLVGAITANDLENTLKKKLPQLKDSFEEFFQDVGVSLFEKIQRDAFFHKKKEEKNHYAEALKQSFEEEGIVLVDEEDTHTKPHNALQKLADNLFPPKKEEGEEEAPFSLKDSLESNREEQRSHEDIEQKKDYSLEKIEDEDRLGVFEHRIPLDRKKSGREEHTTFVTQMSKEGYRIETKEKEVNISSKEDSFLKHIGAV